MATRYEIRSDIILALTKGKPSDDFEIDDRQVDFWIDSERALILALKIKREGLFGLESYTNSFDSIEIKTESIDGNTTGVNNARYVVELPDAVLKLENDIGVYYVETEGGTQITRMKATDKAMMKRLRWAGPSETQILYYRTGENLILCGGNTNYLNNGKVNLLLVLSDTTNSVDDQDDYPISGDDIPTLVEACIRRGIQELQLPEDLLNDGKQQ